MTTEELEIWKRLNKVKRVRPDDWVPLNGDRYIWIDSRGEPNVRTYYIGKREISASCLWIPPLYDPIRPEMSLIGIASVKYDVGCHMNKGWVFHLCDKLSGKQLFGGYHPSRPDIALAFAIIEQEGK